MIINIGICILTLIVCAVLYFSGKHAGENETVGTKELKFPIASVGLIIYAVLNIITLIPAMRYFPIWSSLIANVCFLALAVLLILKKRNIILMIPIAVEMIIQGVGLLNILFGLSLLTVVFLLSEEAERYNIDAKLIDLCKKLYFIPSILLLLDDIICFNRYYFEQMTMVTIRSAIYVISVMLLCQWLANPYKMVAQSQAGTSDAVECNSNNENLDEAYCSLGKHIVLCLFTFGIWYLIWTYRTTKFLNKTPNAEQYNPTNKLLLCMFVPFYQIYWLYKHGQRIDTFSKYKKLNHSDMATLCLILGIFIPIVACILMQDKINALCIAKTPKEKTENDNSAYEAEQLKKFKDLLDSGVITQEEFDAKKKQLLGL